MKSFHDFHNTTPTPASILSEWNYRNLIELLTLIHGNCFCAKVCARFFFAFIGKLDGEEADYGDEVNVLVEVKWKIEDVFSVIIYISACCWNKSESWADKIASNKISLKHLLALDQLNSTHPTNAKFSMMNVSLLSAWITQLFIVFDEQTI